MNINKTDNASALIPDPSLLKAQANEGAAEGEGVQALKNAADRRHVKSERAREAKGGGYQVSLSPQAKDLKEAHAKAHDLAMATPPIREDRVKALKDKIDAGTYEVDAGKIADGMLREAIKDKLALDD